MGCDSTEGPLHKIEAQVKAYSDTGAPAQAKRPGATGPGVPHQLVASKPGLQGISGADFVMLLHKFVYKNVYVILHSINYILCVESCSGCL